MDIFFHVHSRTYASVESAGTALLTDLYVKSNKHEEGSVDENEGRLGPYSKKSVQCMVISINPHII